MRVVLDTSCVRGTPKPTLAALIGAGLELRVSGLAIAELAVYFAERPVTSEDEKQRVGMSNRLAFLSTVIDTATGVAPTHAALIDRLGGRTVGVASRFFASWQNDMSTAWAAMARTDGPSPEELAFLRSIGSYVEETGTDWLETFRQGAALGVEGLSEKEMAALGTEMFRSGWRPMVHLPGKPLLDDRFDAYAKLAGLHAARAYGRSKGQYAASTGNDAIDLNLMQHLGEGVILATKDYNLIESIDASGTRQAPWVRTTGELLFGHAPAGPPWALSARNAKAKHKVRTRSALAKSDLDADADARAAQDRPPSVSHGRK
jgi:hypothetical protein